MRTTLDLDRDLLDRAKKALGASSYTEAIETALKAAIGRSDAATAWESLAGAELSWSSVDDLLDHRRRLGGRTS
jgi:Arc/MetJ family transcription regulator